MTTLGVIALVTWVVGGLPVGIAYAIVMGDALDDPVDRGLKALGGWVAAPLLVALALMAGVAWVLGCVLGCVVGRVERARPTREALERRIRELEDETGIES